MPAAPRIRFAFPCGMRAPLLAACVALWGSAGGAGLAGAAPQAGDTAGMRTQRPDAAGVPTRVEVSVFVVDLFAINNVEQDFTADMYFTAKWKDARLAGETSRRLALDDVWHPNLAVLNERSLDDLLPQVVTVEPDGAVTYVQRLIGSLSARMDLREFPYDRQTLSISVITIGYGPEEVELRPAMEITEGFEEFSISDWKIKLESASVEPIFVPSIRRDVLRIQFRIGAERHVGYYLWVMYLPLVFIVLMAWMVFWIDPSLIPSQIALSTASVFSLIAFRFAMRLSLPAVSYMTRMDKFVLGCTILVFSALGQAVLTGRLSKQGRDVLARRLDQWGRWIYVTAFVVIVIVYR